MIHPALAAGRAAVITGAANGIGLAASKRFAELGMNVCMADDSEEDLGLAEAPSARSPTAPAAWSWPW
jgi:NAD(P)-dependent dehydrogenase (short-subunit alcohol dehydrogenase family)